MTSTEINEFYQRNCNRLSNEINAYKNDASLWDTKEGITNSGGNLALHLIGNLNHFIGAVLGNTGYIRMRNDEFNSKGKSKEELIQMLDEAKEVVNKTLLSLSETDLQKDFPFDFAGKHSTEYYLVFFIAHFEYHLGQINYHRRLS
jgi:uncharacterized damage-inducible protein DinB